MILVACVLGVPPKTETGCVGADQLLSQNWTQTELLQSLGGWPGVVTKGTVTKGVGGQLLWADRAWRCGRVVVVFVRLQPQAII